MNGLGGDNVWLLHAPESDVISIDACDAAAALADLGFYGHRGHATIPTCGPLATLMVAGAACVFAEPRFRPAVIAAVIEDTAARAGCLDPLGAKVPPGSEAYFVLLRDPAAGLVDRLTAG